ncbi:MAG: DUF2079 domain-containing protein [Deltaproteobacteria bacterium]|nr:DUF2079 domain-containing protein [Deltaproteobacteria bacterium]
MELVAGVDGRSERPAAEAGPGNRYRELVRAAAAVLLLVPVAHLLAVAHEWLYFPREQIEELAHAGPLWGFYGPPILRGTLGFLVELLAVGALLAWLRRRQGAPWLRAVREGALHLLPLGLTACALFHDHVPGRLMLVAGVVAGTAAAVAFRALPPPTPTEASAHWPRRLAVALAASAAAWFIALALLRHASYWSSIIDLGLFSGALDSTLRGDRFLYAPELGVTFLAEHFSPILVLLLPLHWLWPDPAMLLVVQSLAVAGGGYLLFRWAEGVLGNGWLALAVAASYLLAPDTFQAQWHDFHMDLLMPPMIFGALLALQRGRTVWFLACVGLLWCTKEDAFVYTALLGLYAALAHRRRLLALCTVAASLVVGLVLLVWVLPAFVATQDPGWFFRTTWSTGTGGGYKFLERYGHLGKSVPAIVGNALSNPFYVLGHVLSEDRLASLLTLTVPLGFAAFLGGLASLLLLSACLVMLVASHYYMNSLSFYYGVIPLCFAYAAGVVGLARIRAWLARRDADGRSNGAAPRFERAALAWVAASALALLWIHPESVISPVHERPAYLLTPRTELLDRVVASVPPDVPLSASGYIGVHLMNRPRPRMVPYGMEHAEWVVLDLYRPPWPLEGPELWHMAERLVRNPGWCVVRAEHGVLVLRRGAPDEAARERALELLRSPVLEPEEWESSLYANLAVRRADASGGWALEVTPADHRGAGWLFNGPFAALPPGEYEVEYRLAAGGEPGRAATDLIGTIDVFRAGEVLAGRDLALTDFERPGAWQGFTLRFRRTAPDPYEFRVFYHDRGTLAVDVIRVRRVAD